MLLKKNFEYENLLIVLIVLHVYCSDLSLYGFRFFLLMYSCKYAVGVHFVNMRGRADIIRLGFVLLSMIFVQF